MTRAEDELYVTGVITKKGKVDGTWYAAIEQALGDACAPCPIPQSEEEGLVFPRAQVPPAALKPLDADARPAIGAFDPPAPPEPTPRKTIRPSTAYEDDLAVFSTAAEAVGDADSARKKGIALHALLQHLSAIDHEIRADIALRALEVLLPDQIDQHERLRDKALSILNGPENQHIFGKDSRAEVPFLLNARQNDQPVRLAGRIDRLVVTKDQILAIDFKSDAKPVMDPEKIPGNYVTQLGLYVFAGKQIFPNHRISAAIFWTANETMVAIPDEMLKKATAAFTLE
jgi:ATP-dependent helicase/nuclease subunit A